jgi:molybdopterin-guanine dinucleotide biosynthesis protein B
MGVDMSKIEISINGKDIDLNPFVEEIITNTIKGMLSPLRGYEEGKIKIKIED